MSPFASRARCLRVYAGGLAVLACTSRGDSPPAQTAAAPAREPSAAKPAAPAAPPASLAETPDAAPPTTSPSVTVETPAEPPAEPGGPPTPRPLTAGRKRCPFTSFTDTPTRALAAALRHWTVDAAFVCPTKFRLVQRRPWVDEFEFGARKSARARELYTFAGVDESSGDTLWMTLGRSDEPGFHGSACGVPDGFRGGWYCVAAAARDGDEVEPLRAWLAARPGEVHALDWLALGLTEIDETVWRSQPRVLHVHEGREVTLCWRRGKSSRCWRLADVDRSEVVEHAGHAKDAALVTTTGDVRRRWKLTAGGGLRGRGGEAWTKVDTAVLASPVFDPDRAVHTVGDGALALGSYDVIGHGGLDIALTTGWLLTRDEPGWTVTAIPDAVVDHVIVAGSSLAVVTVDSHIGDGPRSDHEELLLLAAGAHGREFAGQLTGPVGAKEMSYGGEYEWRYEITSPAPDCIRLAPGTVTGFRLELTDDDDEIVKPLRRGEVFGALDGDWTITRDGPRRGCPAGV